MFSKDICIRPNSIIKKYVSIDNQAKFGEMFFVNKDFLNKSKAWGLQSKIQTEDNVKSN